MKENYYQFKETVISLVLPQLSVSWQLVKILQPFSFLQSLWGELYSPVKYNSNSSSLH